MTWQNCHLCCGKHILFNPPEWAISFTIPRIKMFPKTIALLVSLLVTLFLFYKSVVTFSHAIFFFDPIFLRSLPTLLKRRLTHYGNWAARSHVAQVVYATCSMIPRFKFDVVLDYIFFHFRSFFCGSPSLLFASLFSFSLFKIPNLIFLSNWTCKCCSFCFLPLSHFLMFIFPDFERRRMLNVPEVMRDSFSGTFRLVRSFLESVPTYLPGRSDQVVYLIGKVDFLSVKFVDFLWNFRSSFTAFYENVIVLCFLMLSFVSVFGIFTGELIERASFFLKPSGCLKCNCFFDTI